MHSLHLHSSNVDRFLCSDVHVSGNAEVECYAGLNCNSTLCGRPAHWPADKPFFLPIDLQDPDVWLKIGAAQPTLATVTPEEANHLRV
jgi:hypothetical protein